MQRPEAPLAGPFPVKSTRHYRRDLRRSTPSKVHNSCPAHNRVCRTKSEGRVTATREEISKGPDPVKSTRRKPGAISRQASRRPWSANDQIVRGHPLHCTARPRSARGVSVLRFPSSQLANLMEQNTASACRLLRADQVPSPPPLAVVGHRRIDEPDDSSSLIHAGRAIGTRVSGDS